MIIEIEKNMSCTDAAECSDNILEKLKPLGLKLKAESETDTVNGYISCSHGKTHKITIGIYEQDEKPSEAHNLTHKKPTKIPSKNQIEKLLK
tara:strand:+ start:1393 stop:1668 length:276 start_codon:yes stop_codon:yes gene_type:complete